jgi:multimeric flavodoxin WrbA
VTQTQPIILITFYSRCGSTEKLALAAAVGAVQGRALIRLRRLPDVEEFSGCKETLDRMHREYVAPREADILGADALVLAAPAGFSTSSPEWSGYFNLLTKLRSEGKLERKVGAVVDCGDESTLVSFSTAIDKLGLVAVSHERDATSQGRTVAAAARALKQATGG